MTTTSTHSLHPDDTGSTTPALLVERGDALLPTSNDTTWPTGWDLIGHGTLVADEHGIVTIDLTDMRFDHPQHDISAAGILSAVLLSPTQHQPPRHLALRTHDGHTIWRYHSLIGCSIVHHTGTTAIRVQFAAHRHQHTATPTPTHND